MRGFFDKAAGLTSGWQGINSALVDSATSIAQALGGLAGARKAGGGGMRFMPLRWTARPGQQHSRHLVWFAQLDQS